jgi:hypothetical protein
MGDDAPMRNSDANVWIPMSPRNRGPDRRKAYLTFLIQEFRFAQVPNLDYNLRYWV